MEGNPIIKVSVAELAGKFKDHSVSSCTGYDGNKPVRRRPPRTLQIPAKNEEGKGEDQKSESGATRPARSRNRNSALIEKLQADLALSPMALGPGPMVPPLKSPGQRLQLPGLSPSHPRSPVSPTPPVGSKQEVEAPTSFESPADGALLPSINKGRARLSVRRRPPSRRVKRSGEDVDGDEEGDGDSTHSPAEPAKAEDKETHTAKTHTTETDTAETDKIETDKAEAQADDPGVSDPETKTAGEKEPESADREMKAELKPEAEACTAPTENNSVGETTTTEKEEAKKDLTQSVEQDSSSETKAAMQESDQPSSAEGGQGAEEDGGSQVVKDEAKKVED